MEEEIRKLMEAAPFQPFVIHMVDGRLFRVRHPDFVHVDPFGRVFVSDDHGTDILYAQLMSGIRIDDQAMRPPAAA